MQMSNLKWIIGSVLGFVGMVVLSLLIKNGLSVLGEVAAIEWVDALSAGDLLNALGVFVGLIFAAWSYRKEQLKAEKQREDELKKATPQIDCMLEEDYGGVYVTARNMGSRPLRCFAYLDEPISELLCPGGSARFLLTCDNPREFAPDYCDCPIVKSEFPFNNGCPTSITFTAYDSASRLWGIDLTFEDFAITDTDIHFV